MFERVNASSPRLPRQAQGRPTSTQRVEEIGCVRARRQLPTAIVVSALMVLLAACGTKMPTGDEAGASIAAASEVSMIRRTHGLSTLKPDAKLEKAALQQARYMASSGKMEHTTRRGRDFVSRLKEHGIDSGAENLAHGRMDLEKVFDMWMESEGHRRNMLDGRFDRFGLAYVTEDDGRRYWAMVIGK